MFYPLFNLRCKVRARYRLLLQAQLVKELIVMDLHSAWRIFSENEAQDIAGQVASQAPASNSLEYTFDGLIRVTNLLAMHDEEFAHDDADRVVVVSRHGRRLGACVGQLLNASAVWKTWDGSEGQCGVELYAGLFCKSKEAPKALKAGRILCV